MDSLKERLLGGGEGKSSSSLSLTLPPPSAFYRALVFARAVSWMFWAGFGAPWVLFAMISAIVVHFFPQDADVLASDGFFFASVLGSVGVAVGRTAVILKITFDRERKASVDGHADPEPISHRHYWWCNRAGLVVSCVFVLGDGIGRVFVPATALDFVSLATWLPDGGLYATSDAYFYTIFVISFVSGAYRLAWWIWYWFTFSEVSEKARARIDDNVAEDVIEDGPPVVSRDDLNIVNPDDDGAKDSAIKTFLQSIYPRIAGTAPRNARHAFKRIYAFAGGFGCTWAIFSVISACIGHVTGSAPLAESDWYLWLAVSVCIVGGFYGGLYGGDKRFKVFLH